MKKIFFERVVAESEKGRIGGCRGRKKQLAIGTVLGFWLLAEVLSDREPPLSWDEWSKEDELSRKKVHDDFLGRQLGPPTYDLAWGKVISVIDPHDSAARIVIQYEC